MDMTAGATGGQHGVPVCQGRCLWILSGERPLPPESLGTWWPEPGRPGLPQVRYSSLVVWCLDGETLAHARH
jgi:hypothetical protein